MDLGPLYKRAIEHYKEFESEPWVVKHSIPILYFGDIKAYLDSKRKVVTVGLNPSNAEFAEDRFGLHNTESLNPIALEQALSGYFRSRPYSKWFDRAYETLLQPLGASFYGERHPGKPPAGWCSQRNVALHTDICTPLATSPTWSSKQLPDDVKTRLYATGFPLWRDLIDELQPDLILISVAERHLSRLDGLTWRRFWPFDPAEDRHEMRISELGKSKIVWARGQVLPFFHLSATQRRQAASGILQQTGLT